MLIQTTQNQAPKMRAFLMFVGSYMINGFLLCVNRNISFLRKWH